MRQLYGLRGIKQALAIISFQAVFVAAAVVACVSLLFDKRSVPAQMFLTVAIWICGAVAFSTIFASWSVLREQMVRLDLNRLWVGQRKFVLPAVGLFLATVLVAVSAALWDLDKRTTNIFFGFASAVGAVALLMTAIAIRGTFRHLRYRAARLAMFTSTYELIARSTGTAQLERVREFIDLEAGRGGKEAFPVRGAVYPGLQSSPSRDTAELKWVRELEDKYDEIQAEALQAFANRKDDFAVYPLVGNEKWRSFPFYKGGKRLDANCAQCPETARLIETIVPGGTVREAMLAWLKPGGSLQPHIDNCIPLLTCHMGLLIPDQCGIRVGDVYLQWVQGKCLVIDTTFEHEAWNRSGDPRLILLIDCWPPGLTDAERQFFSAVFADEMRRQATAA